MGIIAGQLLVRVNAHFNRPVLIAREMTEKLSDCGREKRLLANQRLPIRRPQGDQVRWLRIFGQEMRVSQGVGLVRHNELRRGRFAVFQSLAKLQGIPDGQQIAALGSQRVTQGRQITRVEQLVGIMDAHKAVML